VKSAIPHPRILGIIRECGGKMHMHDRAWQDAATDFFEVRLRTALAARLHCGVVRSGRSGMSNIQKTA